MTTISHKRRGKGRTGRTFLLGLLFCIAAGILIVWRGPLTNVFWIVAEPALGAAQSAFNGGEIERLRTQLAAAEALLADRDSLARENADLKARLGRVPEDVSTKLAAVLLRPPGTPYDTLMLDVGLQDGVATGDLVLAGGSLAIGKITEVYRTTSRATLFSAPEQIHDVILITQEGSVPLSAEGQGAGTLSGRLPQGTLVAVGEEILFPDIKPLLVAQVSAVETAPNESFQTVYFRLPINPFLLQYVEVRKPLP